MNGEWGWMGINTPFKSTPPEWCNWLTVLCWIIARYKSMYYYYLSITIPHSSAMPWKEWLQIKVLLNLVLGSWYLYDRITSSITFYASGSNCTLWDFPKTITFCLRACRYNIFADMPIRRYWWLPICRYCWIRIQIHMNLDSRCLDLDPDLRCPDSPITGSNCRLSLWDIMRHLSTKLLRLIMIQTSCCIHYMTSWIMHLYMHLTHKAHTSRHPQSSASRIFFPHKQDKEHGLQSTASSVV